MASCLNNIVTLGICPDDGDSLSGFKLIDAPGISVLQLANIADADQMTGVEMAMRKKELAILEVKNDFLASLQSNGVTVSMSEQSTSSTEFNAAIPMPLYSGYRGITLHPVGTGRKSIKKYVVESVVLYPLQSGDVSLQMHITNTAGQLTIYSWDVTVTGGVTNLLPLSELPFTIPDGTASVKILVDQSAIQFASGKINCLKGCGGRMPNQCFWADGWAGTSATRNESYGVGVTFRCYCDYEQLLCDLSKSYIGELIYIKWQINIFTEQMLSDRFNAAVLYSTDQINDIVLPALRSAEQGRWSALMSGALGLLKGYDKECINCGTRVQWRTNM